MTLRRKLLLRYLAIVGVCLALLGGQCIVRVLEALVSGHAEARPQPAEGVTYAQKIEKHEAAIDWQQDAATIVRKVHAFNPFPGATTQINGESVKVWDACVQTGSIQEKSGTILAAGPDGIAVAAMNSIAILTQLQRAGSKRLAAAEFLRGFPVQVGQVLS